MISCLILHVLRNWCGNVLNLSRRSLFSFEVKRQLLYPGSTGWSTKTGIKYWSITQARKHPWAYYQGAKVHWCSDILIFHGHNQYKWFSKLLFHLASISLKIEIFENLNTTLKIEHSYWNCTEFFITLKQPNQLKK